MKFRLIESFFTDAKYIDDHYIIYKNPTTDELSNKKESKNNRGIIDSRNGDLYVEAKTVTQDELNKLNMHGFGISSFLIHQGLLRILKNAGMFKYAENRRDWWSSYWSIDDFVMVSRIGNTKKFILAESYCDWEFWELQNTKEEKIIKEVLAKAKKKNPQWDFSFTEYSKKVPAFLQSK